MLNASASLHHWWKLIRFELHNPGILLKTPSDGLITGHLVERIPPSEEEAKPTTRCAICCKTNGKRKGNYILV
jgi:hypothetical protein